VLSQCARCKKLPSTARGVRRYHSDEWKSDMRFEGQVAVVTGAGRGIGRAIALRFASEGARVACVSRTEENAKKIADEINGLRNESARRTPVDVADHAPVQKIGARILEDLVGRLSW
jgi:NAD(P)-dependent dehydrogenase (short-subunit alcohol dehydrogenase family)